MSDWRERFRLALERDKPRSWTQLSVDAGLGPAFVSNMLNEKEPREPSVANLRKLCETLGVSFAWVTTGLKVTPDVEELMEIYTKLPDEDRQALLRLSRSMKPAPGTSESVPAPAEAAEPVRRPARR